MLRRFVFAMAAVAALSPLTASAQTVIPSHVNIHNGFIEVRNQIKDTTSGGAMRIYLRHNGRTIQEAHVNAGDTIF
jgi:hypothetical protein